MRSVMFSSPHPILFEDHIKKIAVGKAGGRHRGQERHIKGFGGETWRKEKIVRPRRRREDNIKVNIQEIGYEVEWTDMAHDSDKCLVVVKKVIKLGEFLYQLRNYILVSQEGLCSM